MTNKEKQAIDLCLGLLKGIADRNTGEYADKVRLGMNLLSDLAHIGPVDEALREKAVQLGRKYFPYEYSIWPLRYVEAQCAEFACLEMADYQKKQMKKWALECVRTEYPDGTFIYSTKNLIRDDMESRGILDLDKVKLILIKED